MEDIDASKIQLIEEILNKIRPFIQRDGGDVHFDSYEDGIVYVRVSGACEGCALIAETLYGGIEQILMEEVPGILAVRLASDKPLVKKALEENLKK